MMSVLATLVAIGCYTDAAHPKGLHLVLVDETSSEMSLADSLPAENPLYLAKSGTILYANWRDGLKSFRLADGKLEPIDFVSLEGSAMCYVAAMPDGQRVTWAAYLNGLAGMVAVKDGVFGQVTTHRHCGKGPNLPRQDAAHPHSAVPAPDGRSFAVCDLGLDAIVTYPQGRRVATTPAGAGPRHILFHPNGCLALVVFELGNHLATYEWSDEKGLGRQLDIQRTLPDGPTGRPVDTAAAVRLSPDGRRAIVSNRGEDSLVAFDLNAETGRLAFAARTHLAGSWPRDFIFLSDTLVLVTMERSGELHTLRYNPETGAFIPLKTLGGLHRPVCACAL
ncbi:MAG: lactonase family protein [Kiritimatiellia bacterium]